MFRSALSQWSNEMTRRLGRIRRYTKTLREKEMMEKAKAYAEPMLPTVHDFIMHKMLELASEGNVHAARLVFDEDHRSQERLKYTLVGRDGQRRRVDARESRGARRRKASGRARRPALRRLPDCVRRNPPLAHAPTPSRFPRASPPAYRPADSPQSTAQTASAPETQRRCSGAAIRGSCRECRCRQS